MNSKSSFSPSQAETPASRVSLQASPAVFPNACNLNNSTFSTSPTYAANNKTAISKEDQFRARERLRKRRRSSKM